MSVLLAFDTSTESVAVGLRDGSADHLALLPGGALASAALLPCIRRLVSQAGRALGDIDAIAFGSGPGAFTGLRTSCAVAQGLGFGLARPLLPLDSLLLVAEDARLQVAPDGAAVDITVAMDARMGELYAARYRYPSCDRQGTWKVLMAPRLTTVPAFAASWPEAGDAMMAGAGADAAAAAQPPAGRWLAGSALQAFGERLSLPAGVQQVAGERSRPAALLRLAQAAFDAGQGIDAADALPLYLRDKVAFTTAERAAQRAAAA